MTLHEWAQRINDAAGSTVANVAIVNGEIILSVCISGVLFQVAYTNVDDCIKKQLLGKKS